MVWGEALPSGRERAIETLIDMEPQGAFYRAARVLDEVVPQALANRPNLVTKAALVEQAHGLAEHEIDTLEKYDSIFSSSTQQRTTSNTSSSSLSAIRLNSSTKERILRHHVKLTNVQMQRRCGKPINSTPSKSTSTTCTPSPQLVAALRRIYGGTEDDPSTFKFRSLLKAVMNHRALDLSSPSPSNPVPTPSSPLMTPLSESKHRDEESFTGNGGSQSIQLESLIANVCRLAAHNEAGEQNFDNLLQGLLIAIVSVITESPERIHEADDKMPSTKLRSKQPAEISEDFPMLPTALQVGAVLHLLEDRSDRDTYTLDPDLLAYFGEAAAIYEARIEIQKTRLLAKLQQQAEEKEREAVAGDPPPPPPPPPTSSTAGLGSPTHVPVPLTPTEGAFDRSDIEDVNDFSVDDHVVASAALIEDAIDSDGDPQEPLERMVEDEALNSAAVLDQIISSAATGDETSSSNAEEENGISDSEESDNSDDNDDSDTMEGYDEIGAREVVGDDIVHDHDHDHDDSGPADDNQDEDSSSSSSSAQDDVPMMDDERAIESEVEQDEEDAVLRQALALSLAEQNRADSEDDNATGALLLQVERNREDQQDREALALPDTGGTDTPASRSSRPDTMSCSSDIGASQDGPNFESDENDDSSLPPLPSPPAFYPFESVVSGSTTEAESVESIPSKMPSPYFDPAALNKFGTLPTSHVLMHLLGYTGMIVEQHKFRSKDSERPVDPSKASDISPSSVIGGMGCSLFAPEKSCFQSDCARSRTTYDSDDSDIAVSLQLLVGCFLLITDKRNDAIENLRKALAREQRSVQGDDYKDDDMHKSGDDNRSGTPLSSEEEDDPALALAMNYVDDDVAETADSLEAKGMRRKAAAAAHDAAALLKSLRKRTDAWKQSVELYSQCALSALKIIRLYIQSIVRQWLRQRKSNETPLSAASCGDFLPASVGSKLSMALASLTSINEYKSFVTVLASIEESEINELLMPVKLYKEAINAWVECAPLVYSSAVAQVEMLRSLINECSSKFVSESLPHFRPLESLSTLPTSEIEPQLHRLQMLCRRIRVSDLLDSFVADPKCFIPHEKGRTLDDEVQPDCSDSGKNLKDPIKFSSVVSIIGSSFKEVIGAKGDLQRLYLALCHKCHVRVLLWGGLYECAKVDLDDVSGAVAAPSSLSPSDLVRVSVNPSSNLQFDATKCSDSIAILSSHGDSSSAANGSSVHQRASKVWGTVLSTHHYSPKTGVHRWAVRLDKCERGHVFVGVATAQSSMRTYVGGDKYGWGMIGTQALWHDRRKIRGDYGATFRTGSTIIVTLDTDAGTLSFSSWKDSNSSTSFSLDPLLRRHGHVGGTVEDWGIAFEGLPLDSRLYPAVGLYQRDDRVTLLAVESGSQSRGRDGIMDVSGGQSYYPVTELVEDQANLERILRVRRFNELLVGEGIHYVLETLQQIIESCQQGDNEFLQTALLPCLAASLCLVPPSIPILSERIALNLLPNLSKAISEFEDIRGENNLSHRLFGTGIRDGKWVIRATGSSGASNDFEEYVVDFSASTNGQGTVIGFEGTGVGTTGKSKNGVVAIFGTVKGSSVYFVEEWSDGGEDGFGSASHDETSSCVVAARMSLDGVKFEGTYRNVQFGSTGQIAGMLCDESAALFKLRLKDAPAYSKQSAELAGVVAAGESLLALAHSHLATTVGEDAAGDHAYPSAIEVPPQYNASQWANQVSALNMALSRPLLSGFSMKTTSDSLSRQVESLNQLYSISEGTENQREIVPPQLLDYEMIKGLVIATDKTSGSHPSLEELMARIDSLDSDMTKISGGLGSLSKLCINNYGSSRKLIICAIVHYCDLHEVLLKNERQAELKAVWCSSLKIMEDGLRKALLKAQGGKAASKVCTQQCELHDSISNFLLKLDCTSDVVMTPDEVTNEFTWFYNLICDASDIQYLESAMEAVSRQALLRLVSFKEVVDLLDDSSGQVVVDSVVAVESLVIGIPRLLGRGKSDAVVRMRKHSEGRIGSSDSYDLGGHYLAGLSGSEVMIRVAIRRNVHILYQILGRIAEKKFLGRDQNTSFETVVSIDSLIISLLAVFTSTLKRSDIDEVISGSGILRFLPMVFSSHRKAIMQDVNISDDEGVSVVRNLQAICEREISRSILRAAVAVSHTLIYQTASCTIVTSDAVLTGEEINTAQSCLDLLLNELIDTIASLESATLEAANRFIQKRSEADWGKWCEVGQVESGCQINKQQTRHQVGSSGLKYLRDRGTTHNTSGQVSSQKPSSRQKGNNATDDRSSQDDIAKLHGSFSCQFLSHWLHVLCSVIKSSVSLPLICRDSRWIKVLLNAVGLSVVQDEQGDVVEVNLMDVRKGLLPGRFRARILRLLIPVLETLAPSDVIVNGLFDLAGSASPTATRSLDEDEVFVSREAVSLLRHLHSPTRPGWRNAVNTSMASILASNVNPMLCYSRIGVLSFFSGDLDVIGRGSYVLLKPAAAVPLAVDQQSSPSTKSHSSGAGSGSGSGIGATPHHVVGNGTEGVVAGLCRYDASAGLVSSVDMKNGICEVILLVRDQLDAGGPDVAVEGSLKSKAGVSGSKGSSSPRHTLTVRALRTPLSDVVQAQEVPLYLDEAVPISDLLGSALRSSLSTLFSTVKRTPVEPKLDTASTEKLEESPTELSMQDNGPEMTSKISSLRPGILSHSMALMTLRSAIVALSDEKILQSFLKEGSCNESLSWVLKLAWPAENDTEGVSEFVRVAQNKYLSSLPVHEARYGYLISLLRDLNFRSEVLSETTETDWKNRLDELVSRQVEDVESKDGGAGAPEGYRTPPVDSGPGPGTPPVLAGSSSAAIHSDMDTSSRNVDSAPNRAVSQSTVGSNSEDDEDSEAAATAAAHLREAAIAQMAELGLPRSWSELALRRTGGTNIEAAVHYCFQRGGEMERLLAEERERERLMQRQSSGNQSSRRRGYRGDSGTSNHLLRQLLEMGFPSRWCAEALAATGNNVDEALTWILTNGERLSEEDEALEEDGDGDDMDEDEDESLDDDDEDDAGEGVPEQSSSNLSMCGKEGVGEASTSYKQNESEPCEGWSGSVVPLRFISGRSIIDPKTLAISGLPTGGFSSVGTKGILLSSGKWYYEAILETAGCLQIGWADGSFAGHCHADRGDGCGDGPSSWAYDGWRRYRWHSTATEWGCRWKEGDVVGCLVDLDERVVSFTLNGRAEEIGMGIAFSGEGFRPCGGVYACVSFNRREKLRLILGGSGNESFKHKPPPGYRGVGEAVLDAVKERDHLVDKEKILDSDLVTGQESKRFLCDFSDGEHGHELMAWAHRYYGSDASVHLGSARSKQNGIQKGSSSSPSESSFASCVSRRIEKAWIDANDDRQPSTLDATTDHQQFASQMRAGYEHVGHNISSQLFNEFLVMSILFARKLILHLIVTMGNEFDLNCFLQSSDNEIRSSRLFWMVLEICGSLRCAGWVGEAGAMAIAAEALGLGISSNEHSHSRQTMSERSGITSISDLDDGVFLPTGGITQLLSSVLSRKSKVVARETGSSLAAAAEAAFGSDGGGGVLVFLREGLQSALCKSKALRNVLLAAVRRSVRLLAVVEYEGDDSDVSDLQEDENDSAPSSLERRNLSTKEDENDEQDVTSLPDARLTSFLTGLLMSNPLQNEIDDHVKIQEELFQSWSIGLLSASLPWRMVCAFTAAGLLNHCPQALSKAVESLPTLSKFFGRLESTVARRVWAERAAVPVCSRYVQAMIELLASVKRAAQISKLPPDFNRFWGKYYVDAATPLPLKSLNDLSPDPENSFWESDDGWVSGDHSWEVWTGSVEYLSVDWKTPSRSAVRTLMDGGEGPPMLREGCYVMRGLDWEDDSTGLTRGNEDGKDVYDAEKAKREEEKRRIEEQSKVDAENPESNSGLQDGDSNEEPHGGTCEASDPTDEIQTQDPASVPDPSTPSKEILPQESDSARKKKKRKLPNPKLPLGTVMSIEPWNGIQGMARRVRWNLTGEEGVYRYGGDGGRYDISHVEVNDKGTRVKKRHPLPESTEQCAARHGFGACKRYYVLLRLRQYRAKRVVDGCAEYVREGIMEWPDFGAGVRVSCTLHVDGAVTILEKELLFGSKDSGWEARFGQPSFVTGTEIVLSPTESSSTLSQADLDTRSSFLSFYEELQGSTSFHVEGLRNREDGSTLRVMSEMRLFRARHKERHGNSIPDLIAAPLPPPIHFDRDYHASSLSLSRDGRTVSCIAPDGRGTAFASVGFTKGVHYWEVKLEQADIGSVFIGVAEKPGGSGSGSSYGYDSPPRLNRWHGWGFVNFRATYTSGAERVYGSHCHAGDTVGVMLDCDAGRISFFFDGLKYGEHILNDLGCAFENISPFGFNVDGCGSGGAGQGAPSGIEGGRGRRYPAQGAVRPRALWPVIGLRNQGDRVTISPKWTSSYGVDGITTVGNVLSVDEILFTYSEKGSRLCKPKTEVNIFPEWFVREAFSEYKRWHSASWRRSVTRGSGPYRLASFGLDVDLDASPIACACASAGLGLKYALLAGDRVRLVRSAGRVLELAEEAVVLGAHQGRLFYQIVSQKSEGGSLTEGGGRAWCWDESEVVDGLPFVGKGQAQDTELPLLDRFKCLSSGGLKIVFEGGAVVRSDLEIFDGSVNLGTIPVSTIVPQKDVLERRVNSCGVVRYRVRFEGVGEGWISARLRGGKEECIVEAVHSNEDESTASERSSYSTPLDCALAWEKDYEKTNEKEEADDVLNHHFQKTLAPNGLKEFGELLSQGIIPGFSIVESDSLLTAAVGSISNFSESGDAVDCPFKDIASALSFAISSKGPKSVELPQGSAVVNQSAATVFAPVDSVLPPLKALMARVALIKALNRRARLALPWLSVRPCQEGSAIVGGLCGHGASTERCGRNKLTNSHAQWVQLPSIASRIRTLRQLFFTSLKRGLLQSITEATATPTPLSHDEYELPREIRTVRINRLKAGRAMSGDDIGAKRKYCVFAQLHNETKGWGGAALRREYVAKGHGGQRRAFKVKLIGEGVNDYSGPYREVFTGAMTELLNVNRSSGTLGVLDPTPNNSCEIGENRELFMFSLNGRDLSNSTTWQDICISEEETSIRQSFASLTAARDENAREVEEALVFLGRIVGTAYRHGIPLDLPLPLNVVWKPIVEEISPSEDRLCELDYLASKQLSKGQTEAPLLLWQQRMLNSLVEGLSNVLPVEILTLLTGEELRDTFCGNPDVDVDLLQRVVEYEGYEETDTVIKNFWDTLRELSNAERKVFLQFVWARNRLPLKESDFEAPFKIQRDSSNTGERADQALPSASTCFFSLTLPEYSTKALLKEKLHFAINNVKTMETDFQTNSAEISEGYRAF